MPPTNPFPTNGDGLSSPAQTAVAITPHDSNDLANLPRGIYVGGAGDLTCHMKNAAGAAASVTFSGVPAGTLLPIRPSRILTSSTCTLMVAVY